LLAKRDRDRQENPVDNVTLQCWTEEMHVLHFDAIWKVGMVGLQHRRMLTGTKKERQSNDEEACRVYVLES
jgi:hypothetical protein